MKILVPSVICINVDKVAGGLWGLILSNCRIFSVSGFAISSFLGLGVRSALRHTRGVEHRELGSAKLLSGVGLAFRALGIATVITCSAFGLLVVGISAALDVNTPRQFGAKMRYLCGDRLRLDKKQSIATLREVFLPAEASAVASSHPTGGSRTHQSTTSAE